MKKTVRAILCSYFTIISTGVHANMLSNPGFEAGLNEWQSSGGAAIRTTDPLAYEGLNYVFARNSPQFSVWQEIDLVDWGLSTSEIDAGAFNVEFGSWQSGWNTQLDSGQVTVYLFDINMVEIENSSLPSFFSNHTWVEQSGILAIVSGTRFIRYEFVGTRVEGSNNDGYLARIIHECAG